MSLRQYPVKKPSSAPATGRLLYNHLMENLKIPARANHSIWYEGEKRKLDKPSEYAFRGKAQKGKKVELKSLNGNPLPEPTMKELDGSETVLVKDLTDSAREELGIPENARDKDKVYNPNFVPYEELGKETKLSNELPVLAFIKGVSSWYSGLQGKTNYSELDVLRFIRACLEDLSSPEMMHVLHGNHMAWAVLSYVREDGNVSGDVSAEFHSQNPVDFYTKDLGTTLPGIYFALSQLGQDPVEFDAMLDIEVWGSKDAAAYMRRYSHQSQLESFQDR